MTPEKSLQEVSRPDDSLPTAARRAMCLTRIPTPAQRVVKPPFPGPSPSVNHLALQGLSARLDWGLRYGATLGCGLDRDLTYAVALGRDTTIPDEDLGKKAAEIKKVAQRLQRYFLAMADVGAEVACDAEELELHFRELIAEARWVKMEDEKAEKEEAERDSSSSGSGSSGNGSDGGRKRSSSASISLGPLQKKVKAEGSPSKKTGGEHSSEAIHISDSDSESKH